MERRELCSVIGCIYICLLAVSAATLTNRICNWCRQLAVYSHIIHTTTTLSTGYFGLKYKSYILCSIFEKFIHYRFKIFNKNTYDEWKKDFRQLSVLIGF